ncbi:MAG: glycerate kinase [Hylemonella sp.]|uniref:glycerate kinase n=1 Tax=Hylemonella sp. TaxID=2066020 RepID=UPI0022BB05A6|nr:glycerate kinase [Hylemonella sp.]MCZ8252747.1 glycerate kinase [Hylemonella sp.]
MSLQKILLPIGAVVLVVAGYRSLGWGGVAFAVGALTLWLMLHFTRLMHILKRAANMPLGYVGSAVMLQAKLKPKMTLMHVIAMTRSLGVQISPPDTQPEQFRWTDPSDASVTCDFQDGKLVRWEFRRAESPVDAGVTTLPGLPPAP